MIFKLFLGSHEYASPYIIPCSLFFLITACQGITFKDYLDFFRFMRNISEAELALSFHNAAGKPIDPGISLFLLHFLGVTPNCCCVVITSSLVLREGSATIS